MPDEEQEKTYGGVGFLILVVINLLLFILVLNSMDFLPEIFFFYLMFIGVAQLIYVIPLIIYGKKKNLPGFAKGIIIAAGITFLLNAGCYGILLVPLSNL
ncbi:hypothetical protein MUB24_06940 [Lederbergia sp. NSJ-179]|uniref:Uncharacterized protein n=1 Tax=Lederbergia ruris TaxID=217495 RepID=A0ABQ4KLN9_9BACI|nr:MULTISPECIES: hypothetical protein [Lederbergia]MCJ7840647.1 hypothetical protein [Lederbergia sp. NSJ-179]GIN58807.1 hypothetical protein J8TS2_31260 [Lederbergia ruris]